MTPKYGVTLYVRTPAPMATKERQASVLGRLDALRAAEVLDDVTVTYWVRQATNDDAVMPSVGALEEWAEANDVTLAPAFDRHDRSNWYTGHDDVVVSLPVICLAVFEDEDIVSVYPHRGRNGNLSVSDGLDRLEATLLGDTGSLSSASG